MSTVKKKNHITIPFYEEKHLKTSNTQSVTLKQVETEGKFLQLIKSIDKEPTANSAFTGETECSPSTSGQEAGKDVHSHHSCLN